MGYNIENASSPEALPTTRRSRSEDELCKQDKHKQTIYSAQNCLSEANLAQSKPKRDIKPPNRLDL